MKFSAAINDALDIALARDPRVYVMGLGAPDEVGIYGTTRGLAEKHPGRVLDMPCSENAMTGVAIGSCLTGMRPVMTHARTEFAMAAMDQICNQAAKWRYMFGGNGGSLPLVIRIIVGRGWGQGPQHSQSLHSWFAHIPGLTVIAPSTVYDAKGMLLWAIEQDDPVIFLEHRWLHGLDGEADAGRYIVEPSTIHRFPGEDVTIVASSYAALEVVSVARELVNMGITPDIFDTQRLSSRCGDDDIVDSVICTGRLVVVDHGHLTCGYAADIVATVSEHCHDDLKAAPVRVTLPDVPTPTTRALANYFYPSRRSIIAACRKVMGLDYEADPFAGIDPADKTLDVPNRQFQGPF